jgi:hypothetical protein
MNVENESSTEVETLPPAKSDAEQALRDAAKQEAPAATEPEATEAKPKPEKPNRTGAYIERLQERARAAEDRARELEARLATPAAPAHHSSQPRNNGGAAEGEPTLEGHNYDLEAYTRAHSRWGAEQIIKERETAASEQRERQTFQQTMDSYAERAAEFEESHPDYREAIDGFFADYQPSREIQLAIIGHERGPEIAYYVANSDDEAFTLANTLPQNAAAAVSRLIKRMDAAQQAPIPSPPPVRTISQAPAPTPRVGGRSVAVVPPEKQTDDDWYRADLERRRKR